MANTRASSSNGGVSLNEAAAKAGVSPGTLRRWAREGLIPQYDGDGSWSPGAISHARIVARLRERDFCSRSNAESDYSSRCG